MTGPYGKAGQRAAERHKDRGMKQEREKEKGGGIEVAFHSEV